MSELPPTHTWVSLTRIEVLSLGKTLGLMLPCLVIVLVMLPLGLSAYQEHPEYFADAWPVLLNLIVFAGCSILGWVLGSLFALCFNLISSISESVRIRIELVLGKAKRVSVLGGSILIGVLVYFAAIAWLITRIVLSGEYRYFSAWLLLFNTAIPFALLGFLVGSLVVTFYNWIARFTGGIEVQVVSGSIKRIGVISLGDTSGLYCALVGLIVAGQSIISQVWAGLEPGQDNLLNLCMGGLADVITVGILGFIVGNVIALTYNWVSHLTGGVSIKSGSTSE